MDLGSSPERILKTHSSDKVAHLFSDPRSATERTRLPSPVSGEAHSVPTHNSFGPDDGYGIKNARKATIEPNEQGAVGPAQIQSTWCALSKHVQLMTQNQKFSVKPPSRLEAIAHHADEKEGDCDHQRGSCSDSGTAATPADRVFGSDKEDQRRWLAYEKAKAERDTLATELTAIYPSFEAKLRDLLPRIAESDKQIEDIINRSLPLGAEHLLVAELVARDLKEFRIQLRRCPADHEEPVPACLPV